jgi:hypothetical protein
MKAIRKLSGILIFTIIAGVLPAQNTGCNIRKSFLVGENTYFRIINKFGDININTVNNDSISLCASISIKQDDPELLKKNISLIKTEISKSGDTIDVRTVFDEKFFSPANRKGRSGFSIDYIINVPASTNLSIQNEFGDIALDDIKGILNVSLSNGDFVASRLTRGNLNPVSSLQFELGKITIDEANWISMTARHCQSVKISKATALLLTSESSRVNIDELSSLVCKSKYDNYNITSIKNLIAESFYTSFQIEKLSGQLQARTTYGKVSVSELVKNFTTVDLICNRTPVELISQKGTSFKADITATNTLLEFPFEGNPNISRSNKNNTTTISGIVGNDNATKSLIKIKSDFGALKIQ